MDPISRGSVSSNFILLSQPSSSRSSGTVLMYVSNIYIEINNKKKGEREFSSLPYDLVLIDSDFC